MFVYTVNDGRTFSPDVQADGVGVSTGSVSRQAVKTLSTFFRREEPAMMKFGSSSQSHGSLHDSMA